jgi:hypothetical protein
LSLAEMLVSVLPFVSFLPLNMIAMFTWVQEVLREDKLQSMDFQKVARAKLKFCNVMSETKSQSKLQPLLFKVNLVTKNFMPLSTMLELVEQLASQQTKLSEPTFMVSRELLIPSSDWFRKMVASSTSVQEWVQHLSKSNQRKKKHSGTIKT